MKKVILSADGDSVVYSVPDVVADKLEKYCLEFCTKWIRTGPEAKKYRMNGGVCYDQTDFIAYLNQYLFPNEQSKELVNLGWIADKKNIPTEYRDCPYFNF